MGIKPSPCVLLCLIRGCVVGFCFFGYCSERSTLFWHFLVGAGFAGQRELCWPSVSLMRFLGKLGKADVAAAVWQQPQWLTCSGRGTSWARDTWENFEQPELLLVVPSQGPCSSNLVFYSLQLHLIRYLSWSSQIKSKGLNDLVGLIWIQRLDMERILTITFSLTPFNLQEAFFPSLCLDLYIIVTYQGSWIT